MPGVLLFEVAGKRLPEDGHGTAGGAATAIVSGGAAAAAATAPATPPEAGAAAGAGDGAANQLQGLYQQLAACLVVKLARRAVEAPPREAFTELGR